MQAGSRQLRCTPVPVPALLADFQCNDPVHVALSALWTGTRQVLVSGAASITTSSAPVLPSALAVAKQSVLECPSAVGMDATSARKNGPQTADA